MVRDFDQSALVMFAPVAGGTGPGGHVTGATRHEDQLQSVADRHDGKLPTRSRAGFRAALRPGVRHDRVPGLAGTAEYARAVLATRPNTTDKQVDEFVTGRLERQVILDRDQALPRGASRDLIRKAAEELWT